MVICGGVPKEEIRMGMLKCVKEYILQRPMKYIVFCIIILAIIYGEFIGLYGLSIAKQGEKDLFLYNGAAISLYSQDYELSDNDFIKIREIDNVTGINNFTEINALPKGGIHNVKEHVGADPKLMSEMIIEKGYGDEILTDEAVNGVILEAHMDTELSHMFHWEKAVSLVEGVFPSNENKGVLVESRFAQLNNLKVGDSCTFNISEYGKDCTYSICGIYKVDSEFYINKKNGLGEGVYSISPYNKVYMDYDTAVETIGLKSAKQDGCGIYVDQLSHVDGVISTLEKMFGDNVDISNNELAVSEDESSQVKQTMDNAIMVIICVTCIGGILLLVLSILFSKQNNSDGITFSGLGFSKLKTIMLHVYSMLAITLVSFVLALVLYGVTPVNSFYEVENAFDVTEFIGTDEPIGPYITPNLNLPFSLNTEAGELFTQQNILLIVGFVIFIIAICLVMPVCNVLTKKREINVVL